MVRKRHGGKHYHVWNRVWYEPTVQVSDSEVTLTSFSYGDGYIYLTATVPSDDPHTSAQVTVVCNGYGDSGFSQDSPPNGASQTSTAYTITISH